MREIDGYTRALFGFNPKWGPVGLKAHLSHFHSPRVRIWVVVPNVGPPTCDKGPSEAPRAAATGAGSK